MRQVDDKTLSVLDLPVPPGMAYDGDGVIKDPISRDSGRELAERKV